MVLTSEQRTYYETLKAKEEAKGRVRCHGITPRALIRGFSAACQHACGMCVWAARCILTWFNRSLCLQGLSQRAPAIFRTTALDTHGTMPVEDWGPRHMPEPRDPSSYRVSLSTQGGATANSQKAAQILAAKLRQKEEAAFGHQSVFRPTQEQQPACSVVSAHAGSGAS